MYLFRILRDLGHKSKNFLLLQIFLIDFIDQLYLLLLNPLLVPLSEVIRRSRPLLILLCSLRLKCTNLFLNSLIVSLSFDPHNLLFFLPFQASVFNFVLRDICKTLGLGEARIVVVMAYDGGAEKAFLHLICLFLGI